MKNSLELITSGLKRNQPTAREAIAVVESQSGVRLPDEYILFMLQSNGAEGMISKSYLSIWPIERLVQANKEYEVDIYTPGLIYFGSDGGGMAYAFDYRSDRIKIVEFPFESIYIEDAKTCAESFNDFLQYLYNIK